MGVPVVSLIGPTALSRSGASVMGNLGLDTQWTGTTTADYLRIAQTWANQSDRLAELRGRLRSLLQKSPLTDAARFTSALEQELLQRWRSWCDLRRG